MCEWRFGLYLSRNQQTIVVTVSPEILRRYRETLKLTSASEEIRLAERRARAWELARKAAAILRGKYSASTVKVFGSLAHEAGFTQWSDVDVAAWGIPTHQTFRAMADLLMLDVEITVQLVDVNTCTEALREIIEQAGVEI